VGTILTYKPHGDSQNDCDTENAGVFAIAVAHHIRGICDFPMFLLGQFWQQSRLHNPREIFYRERARQFPKERDHRLEIPS